MDWTDPLRKLAPSVAHPSPESVTSSELSSVFGDNDRWYETRNTLLKALDDGYTPNGPEDDTTEVLRTFVMKLPKDGQLALMSEIYHLKDDGARLRQLRNFLVDAILKPMMAAGGKSPRTPIPSMATTIKPSFRDEQASLKADCLRREDYRCALSRVLDENTENHPAAERMAKTHCAHILPFALRHFDDQNAPETENKATIWWALYRYFPDLKDLIGPSSISQCQNVLTLITPLHEEFGNFNLGLEPLGDNQYRVCWMKYVSFYDTLAPKIVTLKSRDPSVQLPNPAYIWVHYRIAEILDVSGIGKKIEDTWKECIWDPDNIEPYGSTDIGSVLSRKMLTSI
ncbi:hypothetical protein GGR54DRAFT_637090 [Hypoxylon sp. NC1633]|nr:hypothetical protein GGR54DRAFT_637090 [Hypoxylon sp. NC1633]